MAEARIPEVWTAADGTVVLELTAEHAEVLAKILAHYDALVTEGEGRPPADGYEPPVWHHTLLRLLTENARYRGRLGEVVEVANLTGPLVHRGQLYAPVVPIGVNR